MIKTIKAPCFVRTSLLNFK